MFLDCPPGPGLGPPGPWAEPALLDSPWTEPPHVVSAQSRPLVRFSTSILRHGPIPSWESESRSPAALRCRCRRKTAWVGEHALVAVAWPAARCAVPPLPPPAAGGPHPQRCCVHSPGGNCRKRQHSFTHRRNQPTFPTAGSGLTGFFCTFHVCTRWNSSVALFTDFCVIF